MTLNFQESIKDDLLHVEDLMRAQADGLADELKAATSIMLASGGKRIRPSLTLLVGRSLGGDQERLVTLSAAIELLHTATLVHDDLIDGSLLRRGVPTLSARWSSGATVLTGDFMFAKAARLAAETDSLEAMKVFAQTLAVIVNGELEQLFTNHCAVDRQSYLHRTYAKTASLFETSALTAALISSMDEQIHVQYAKFGFALGMAFQIVDDILDFTADSTKLGKPVGNDLRQGIVTLPVIIYAENNPGDEEIATLVDGKCLEDDAVDLIIEKVRNSNAIENARQEGEAYIESAISMLSDIDPGAYRSSLIELSSYITRRVI